MREIVEYDPDSSSDGDDFRMSIRRVIGTAPFIVHRRS
jgi:hypothetical protein